MTRAAATANVIRMPVATASGRAVVMSIVYHWRDERAHGEARTQARVAEHRQSDQG